MRPPAEGRRHGGLRLAIAGCTPGRLEICTTSLPRGRGSQRRGHERADVKLRHRGSPLKTRGQAWGTRTENIPALVHPTEARCV